MSGVNLINRCETCTRRWKNFQHLTKDELQLVNENRYEATFKPGEIMIKQGSHIRMVNLAQKRMSGRLAEVLLYFSDEVFNKDEYEMILSRQEHGEMTNMTKECVVRILKELEDSGVIYSDSSKIKILDKEKLIQISERG